MIELTYSIASVYAVFVIISVLLYAPKLAQYLGALRKPPHREAKIKRKISIIIPARNESRVIGDLFDSIMKQDYDRDYFTVNVVVKEATDRTVELAKTVGAKIFIVPEQNCKGAALDGYFKAISKEERESFEAFVIVDADAVLSSDYVTELNNALEYDRQIFVTKKYIKNYLDGKSHSITCDCAALVYSCLDELANQYRAEKNIPLNFCGQGLMLRRSVIEAIGGWPYRSLTEDYELKMDSLVRGFSSMFYPYAKIYTEEVETHSESWERRTRWLRGFSFCEKKYKKQVKKAIKERGRTIPLVFDYLHYRDAIFIYLLSSVLSIVAGVTLCSICAVQLGDWWLHPLLALIVAPCGLTYIIMQVYAIFNMLASRDVIKDIGFWRKVRLLIFCPLFNLEFIPLYIYSRLHTFEKLEWKEIRGE